MGRNKYSDEERNRIISTFIRAAREIIETEGIDKVTIRKVSAVAGYNSSTMYLYFPNVDTLITMASMSYLEKYCRTLAADMPLMNTHYATFTHTWEVFSRFAFAYPNVFYHLFYRECAVPMDRIIKDYYRLYPHQLDNIKGNVFDMLNDGNLYDRCMKVLEPLGKERGWTDEKIDLINDLSICYFRELLVERIKNPDSMLESSKLTEKLMYALEFLLAD